MFHFNLCLFLMRILHTCHLFLFLRIAKHCSSSGQKYSCFSAFQLALKEINAFKQWQLDSCTSLG